MSMEQTKNQLTEVATILSLLKADFINGRTGYKICAENLAEVLTHLQLFIPVLVQDAVTAYDTGVMALRRASQVYESKVIPALEASGIESVADSSARLAIDSTHAVSATLKGITGRVLTDHIEHEMFDQLEGKVASLSRTVSSTRETLYREIVDEDSGVITKIVDETRFCREAVIKYRDEIDS
jgi:hypothetical protein